MLAEARRCAAQRRLAAPKTDRRGDALVPILFDDIATMERVGAGQRLVDPLHRARGQAGREQAVTQGLRVVLAEHRGEFGAQGLTVRNAVLVAGKARIAAELRLAD